MLQYASATGLVKMILIILLVYFGIKILARLFTPFLVKYITKKTEQKFGQQFKGFQGRTRQDPIRKEGEVTIDKIPKTKTSNKNVGDYVDYEEID
ncbi:DUF4834 family protein [Tamlana sp. 2201CG12-4]|uniref:DUF4834 family protein n=1 Tax=Tamlana sp. 2201CG12-4 TaxID=3112582 RepID=UPI002DBDD503|nr:DUF4834 family protein [Tamlana sp. 2201CG12-4]MEC3907993.1 DUF4834 family protein [Tamlana sp. 2201CG12-4]